MKKVYISLIAGSLLFGYYGKVEPYQTYNIKSDVSGKVVEVNKSAEATNYKGIVIQIDDYQNKIDLKNLKIQLKNFQNILKSQTEIMNKKKKTYEIYKTLKTKSEFDKDLKFYDYQNSLIALNQTKNTISNLKAQIAKLKDTISKKSIKFNNYIYKIDVNKGDFLNPAMRVATTMDLSKIKIDIYVPIDKIDTIKNKTIYINSKPSDFKIDKIYKVADEKYVTSYKVEIIGKYPKISDVVKVEFK
jgi:multidrug resistance efflux pump